MEPRMSCSHSRQSNEMDSVKRATSAAGPLANRPLRETGFFLVFKRAECAMNKSESHAGKGPVYEIPSSKRQIISKHQVSNSGSKMNVWIVHTGDQWSAALHELCSTESSMETMWSALIMWLTPFSSNSAIFRGVNAMKSRCGTTNRRPSDKQIANGRNPLASRSRISSMITCALYAG